MKVNLGNDVEFEHFEIEDAQHVERLAEEIKSSVYSWKAVGYSNWLQKGFSIVDVLGLTILPHGLPDRIDLPDDKESPYD